MQKRSLFAVLSLATVAALYVPVATAQTSTGTTGSASKESSPGSKARSGGDASSPSSGYSGSSTNGGAQNQPRNGGATGSAGKAPNDGHAPVNPTSRANRNGAATGS